ncbi:MAG: rod shape-determining protein MreC [Limisphaerales bacterium]
MLKKTRYLALAFVALVALVLLNLPAGTAARLRLAVSSQFLPLFGLARVTEDLAGVGADHLVLSKRELVRQNERLRQENAELRLLAVQATNLFLENARLTQLTGWQRQQPWRLKLGRVVLRDPANWWRTVQIDLGSQHGIRADMPVLTIEGLVGRVTAVGQFRSQVVLLGDPACRVAAQVRNDAGDTGVIGAGSPLERELVTLTYLPRNAAVRPGQAVVTSGQGGIFPRGIPVGTVVDAQPVEHGLHLEARVQLAANLGALDEVWVLTEWTR